MNASPARLLLIEDDPQDARLVQELLGEGGTFPHTLKWAGTLTQGLEYLAKEDFDAILADLSLPDSEGFSTVQSVVTRARHVPVIVITGRDDESLATLAIQEGTQDYLVKEDMTGRLLVATIRHAIERNYINAGLRQDEEQFRATFERAAVGIAHVGPGGGYLRANRRFCHMLGYTQAELLDLTFPDVTFPDDVAAGIEYARQVWAGEISTFSREKRYVRKDGSIFWGNVTVSLACDPAGAPPFLIVVVEDITGRKGAEEALQESKEKYRALVEATSDWIWEVDENLHYTYASPQLENLLGYDPDKIVGKSLLDLMLPSEIARVGGQMQAIVAARAPLMRLENANLHKNGATVILETSGTPIFDAEGNFRGYRGIGRDITERRRAEELIKQHVAEIERSNKELEEYATATSHDLKSPLTAILGFAELLEKECQAQLDPAALAYVQSVRRSGKRMEQMIDAMLAVACLKVNEEDAEVVDCEELLASVLEDLHFAISEAGTAVTHDYLPAVIGVRALLGQVFANLLGNAIKFRRADPPVVHVSAAESETEWTFSVQDNGIGFDPQYAGAIFALFRRLHAREEYAGTGVGLATCKKIVEKHGGKIWAESVAGEGSTFFFTLPKSRLE